MPAFRSRERDPASVRGLEPQFRHLVGHDAGGLVDPAAPQDRVFSGGIGEGGPEITGQRQVAAESNTVDFDLEKRERILERQ